MCGIFYVNAKNIVLLILGDNWLPMLPLFQIIISGGFSQQIYNLIYNFLLSNNRTNDILKVNAFNKILLILSLPIITCFDLETYLYVFISINFLNLFLGVYFVNKIILVGKDFTKIIFKFFLIIIFQN